MKFQLTLVRVWEAILRKLVQVEFAFIRGFGIRWGLDQNQKEPNQWEHSSPDGQYMLRTHAHIPMPNGQSLQPSSGASNRPSGKRLVVLNVQTIWNYWVRLPWRATGCWDPVSNGGNQRQSKSTHKRPALVADLLTNWRTRKDAIDRGPHSKSWSTCWSTGSDIK